MSGHEASERRVLNQLLPARLRRVRRQLLVIGRDLRTLVAVEAGPPPVFGDRRLDRMMAESLLETCIERMIEINHSLIAAVGLPPAADAYNSFLALEDMGVLDHAMAVRVARCARLHARLTDEDAAVGPYEVFVLLEQATDHIGRYVTAVREYLALA